MFNSPINWRVRCLTRQNWRVRCLTRQNWRVRCLTWWWTKDLSWSQWRRNIFVPVQTAGKFPCIETERECLRTPIENSNYLSSFLWGSNHNSRPCLGSLSNSNSEKAIAAFLNTVVHEGKIDYFDKLPTGFLSASSSLKPLFWALSCKKYCKIRLRFAIWAFSSLWIKICSLRVGFKTSKISFLPLINTSIPTSAGTLKVLCLNYFLLTLMYLLRQYIY